MAPFDWHGLDTKSDLAQLREELRHERASKADLHELRAEFATTFATKADMSSDFDRLRTQMRTGDAALRHEMTDGFGRLRTEMNNGVAELRRDMRLTMGAALGFILTAVAATTTGPGLGLG